MNFNDYTNIESVIEDLQVEEIFQRFKTLQSDCRKQNLAVVDSYFTEKSERPIVYSLHIDKHIVLLPFNPPKKKTLKNIVDSLGMLSLRNRDALRKLILKNDIIYFKNPDIPKIYLGEEWLSSGFEIPLYQLKDPQEVSYDTYINVLVACFGRNLLVWWAHILDLKTLCRRHLMALRTYSIIYDDPNEPCHFFKSIGREGQCLLMDADKKVLGFTKR